ncbi:DUF4351 domain-containing protein [Alkalinema sp. FACHB-956]|uniref:DUF4351 domain-containing protein n=1 Tax=Alkalinema sp. FACHB-956 TaxID=2692768 RepID=UPI001686FB1C|nr:DUF4351 domain-containing protein [Alkalinema sp. FACHB-956]MBD2330019.1 DUF4351 domain-containing protein [Alkalinema sp. FACHB-956]
MPSCLAIAERSSNFKEEKRRSLIALQLEQKLGELSEALHDRVDGLAPEQIRLLAIALFRFELLNDLTTWLESRT